MSTAATTARTCRKCGATIFPEGPSGFCGACLLETGLGALPDETEPSPVLMDFGDYELLEELGRGGQGVVYRARQKGLNRIVALKIIGLGHWATEAHLKRFRLEAEAAAQLDHPAIVPIYEIGERDGACFFSMKFIEGSQLDELVRQKPLSVREAVQLVAKIARTVQYAHEHGVLHRDLKPGNIMIDREGDPHLTDFGLARLVEKESNVTNSFDVLGTPSYMAPEQAAGNAKGLTEAADVYGLGAVFYQLITGQPPFAGGTTYETIRLVMETEPRRPSLWNSKVDRDLETIALKCLEKEPQKRYHTALALAEDLEHWMRHEPIRARRIGVLARTRKWVRRNPATALLVPALAALAAAVGVIFWKIEPSPPPTGIAVLPFEYLGDDKENTFLADGIQDDILTKLAKVADLKVISRTSVMQYRGARNVRKIGDALRVSHVLEGSVRRDGRQIHLNAQLIDARSDQHVWAEQYAVDLADVFSIQSRIAQTIATQLKSKVSTQERAAIEARPTQNLEAYELYLHAKALLGYTSVDDPTALEKAAQAVDLLDKAISRDPNFALAYCLLTETNLTLYWVPGRSDLARRGRAETALAAARRLAPDAGETHLAQALFHYYGSRDYDHALEQLDIAARSLPNSSDVFRIAALIERRLARWAETLRHFSKAHELSPRDPSALVQLALTHIMLRHYAEADQVADRAITLFPTAADPFWNLKGELALGQGDLARARSALEKISSGFPGLRYRVPYYARDFAEAERVSLSVWQGKESSLIRYFALSSALAARAAGADDRMRSYLLTARQSYEPLLGGAADPGDLSSVGIIDAALGRKEDALREARRAVELRSVAHDPLEGPEYVQNLALVYAWTGNRDSAFEQLLAVASVPAGPSFGELKFDPVWDSLRNDPRFARVMAEAARPIPLQ